MKKRKKKSGNKEKQDDTITIKPHYKHRVPHRPTRVHRNRKKYTRKGKTREQLRKELLPNNQKD